MSGEIARLQMEIASRKHRLKELGEKIDVKIRDLKAALEGYPFVKVDALRASHIAETAKEIEKMQAEWLAIKHEIEAGEKELNGE